MGSLFSTQNQNYCPYIMCSYIATYYVYVHMESDDQTQRPRIRKGAWMREEDDLLRKCIQKYGEGHWNQVPLKAGLNRCRKSCRLRWLNYLKPDIKRGEFEMDEVDLLTRMHKLIGNRWSLIAGRLPGRTANDVKNYWNTHLKKKQPESHHVDTMNINSTTASTKNDKGKVPVIRPQAQSFSENSKWIKKRTMHRSDHEQPSSSSSKVVINTDGHEPLPEFLTDDALTSWWQENIDLLISHDDHERMMKKKGVVVQRTSEEAENVINSGCKSTTDQSKTTSKSKDKEQDLSVDDYLLDEQKFHGDKRNTNNVVGDEGLQSDDFDHFINLFINNGHKF